MLDIDKFKNFLKSMNINFEVELDADGDGNDYIFIQDDTQNDITFKFRNGKYTGEINVQ